MTRGTISGVGFGDYFYNIQQRDTSKKDLNGFQYRRFQFTYDYKLSEHFDVRFRLEADEVTRTSNNHTGVFVKDAYLRWRNILPLHDLTFGISPTPAFQVSEGVWGYRCLEKTLMDLWGVVNSRDFGIDLRGKLDVATTRYWIKVANNSGVGTETDKYKRYYGLFHVKPTAEIDATVYADYDTRARKLDPVTTNRKSNNRMTFGGFFGVSSKNGYSAGIEGVYRITENGYQPLPSLPLKHQRSFGVSVFGWYAVEVNVRIVTRYDYFDMNAALASDAASFIVAGLDYEPAENVHIIPNIHLVRYQSKGAHDVVGRMTLCFSY